MTYIRPLIILCNSSHDSREKSRAASRRENEAKSKFDSIKVSRSCILVPVLVPIHWCTSQIPSSSSEPKNKMETAMVENTILELRGSGSHSPLKAVPTVLMNNIFSYVFGSKYKGLQQEEDSATASAAVGGGAAAAAVSSKGRRTRKPVNYSELNVDSHGNDTNTKKVSKVEVETGIYFSNMELYEP